MRASLAIVVMWLSVLVDAIFGPDIVNTTVGGETSTVPSAVADRRAGRPNPKGQVRPVARGASSCEAGGSFG
jgi:hypothetical protein